MNTGMRKLILRVDGLSLGAFGLFGISMDLLSYFAGIGSWQSQFLNNPNAIGFVEAHGLALMVAALLVRSSMTEDRRAGHGLGMMAHLLLGTANLLFWQMFVGLNQLPLGYITTSYHWIFVGLNGLALLLAEAKQWQAAKV